MATNNKSQNYYFSQKIEAICKIYSLRKYFVLYSTVAPFNLWLFLTIINYWGKAPSDKKVGSVFVCLLMFNTRHNGNNSTKNSIMMLSQAALWPSTLNVLHFSS